jgi:DNA uptake protein ComE-like DNA-binding protein
LQKWFQDYPIPKCPLRVFCLTPRAAILFTEWTFIGERTDLFNLNTATVEQLKARPGMGETYAEKIIKGRPYQGKEEVVQKKILSRAAYEGIKYKVVVKQK